jgi:hypothetical protein
MLRRSFLCALLVHIIGGAALADRTVYTVVMCDTNLKGSASLRAKVTKCGQGFCSMVEGFRDQGIACEPPALIRGNEIGLDEVRRRVSAFPIDNNDTLLFYYIGHGVSRARTHVLATSRGEITRDEVRTALMSAARVQPRLTLLLTECCANEAGPKDLGLIPLFGLSLDERVPNKNLLANLLFDHTGLVDATSSSHDESSQAGFFFDSLRYHMEGSAKFHIYDVNGDGFVSWKEFFPSIARTTNALFKKIAVEGEQSTQIPFAFSLGTAPGETDRENYAANLGLHFTIISRDFWNAAKLTRDPAPNTPAGRIGLRAGDVLDTLDDLPIWNPIDVYGHHLDTKVNFYRGGRLMTTMADLPQETPFPSGVPTERYSRKFVMSYQLIPFGDKKFAARVTRLLANESPLKAHGFAPGDMIVKLDGDWIGSDQDVANHFGRTEIIYLDVRTGLLKQKFAQLP